MRYTPLEDIPKIHASLKASFISGKTRDVQFRKQQLAKLAYMLKENIDALCSAIYTDLHRSPVESLPGDILGGIDEAIICYQNVDEWAKDIIPTTSPMYDAFKCRIKPSPKGVVLIISPFNFPIVLSLSPLAGAIAAGCTVVLKLPERLVTVSPLMEALIAQYLDPEVVRVVQGAEAETLEVLKLQWDHILFTGGGRVGRIVSTAAAKFNTPTTMELGGKNPVIIDPNNADYTLIARRILWGRTTNSGQICVGPEYVLIPSTANSGSTTISTSPQAQLAVAFKAIYKEFYPEGAQASEDLARIISTESAERISSYFESFRKGDKEGKLVLGGKVDVSGKFIEPSVICDVPVDSKTRIMEDEVFGPILCIVPVKTIQDAIDYINARPVPLSLYIFSQDEEVKEKITRATRSGFVIYNDVVLQVGVPNLPMGGTSDSGHGAYKGKFGFDTFTHYRANLETPLWLEPIISGRYPPFTPEKLRGALALIPVLPFDRDGKPLTPLGVSPPFNLPGTITIPGFGINLDVRAVKEYIQPIWVVAAVIPAILAFLYYR